MVICQYFLTGSCRYGDRCRNEHSIPNRQSRENYRSPLHQNIRGPMPVVSFYEPEFRATSTYGQNSQRPAAPANRRISFEQDPDRFRWVSPTYDGGGQNQNRNLATTISVLKKREEPMDHAAPTARRIESSSRRVTDEQSLVSRVSNDIAEWQESGQWPFSCYGFKDLPSILEFIDLSPEELRLRAYEACRAKKAAQYKTEVKNLLSGIRLRWAKYSNLSPSDHKAMEAYLKPYVVAKSPIALPTKPEPTPLFSTFKSPNSGNLSYQAQRPKPQSTFKLLNQGSSTRPQPMQPQQQKEEKKSHPIYARMDQLTRDELKAFNANEFATFDEIPIRPPPKELC